jgi:hypothetical protein
MEEDEVVDQPLKFDLELELVRWVKVATTQTIPPLMVKPSGPIIQHYGLDSKSRLYTSILYCSLWISI